MAVQVGQSVTWASHLTTQTTTAVLHVFLQDSEDEVGDEDANETDQKSLLAVGERPSLVLDLHLRSGFRRFLSTFSVFNAMFIDRSRHLASTAAADGF